MPTHKYPFLRYVFKDTRKEIYLTRIPVRITNPLDDIYEDTYALIDTGADECVIPADLAERLKHNLKGDGVESHFTYGIGGKQVTTYKHTFDIGLMENCSRSIVWNTGSMLVDCVDSEIPPILGVKNFLKKFSVTIDYPRKNITLSW